MSSGAVGRGDFPLPEINGDTCFPKGFDFTSAGTVFIDPNTELFRSVSGDVEGIKIALANGANVNAQDRWGDSPLSKAVIFNSSPVISFLIEKGANVDQKGFQGDIPIDLGTQSYIDYLKQAGKLKESNGSQLTVSGAYSIPLYRAIGRILTDLDTIKYLVDKGAKLQITQLFPLLTRANNGYQLDTLKLLISLGINLNETNSVFGTALHLAVKNEDIDLQIIKTLIENGAQVNALAITLYQAEPKTPLDLAVTDQIKEILIKAGGKTSSGLSQ